MYAGKKACRGGGSARVSSLSFDANDLTCRSSSMHKHRHRGQVGDVVNHERAHLR